MSYNIFSSTAPAMPKPSKGTESREIRHLAGIKRYARSAYSDGYSGFGRSSHGRKIHVFRQQIL